MAQPNSEETESTERISIAAPQLGEEERNGVLSVLESGMIADGEAVRRFEHEFARTCNRRHGIATSNGTTALHTALHALDIGYGDVVVTTPFSFIASANAIRLAGAVPVFADIDPKTFTLDPAAVEKVIRDRDGDVDAILVVHLYGLAADMGRLQAIANRHDLLLVEDCAQAHGATFREEPVGSFGDAAAFSFYPTKNMTTGEGGMVVTDDDAVAERARRFIDHGRVDGYTHSELGHNFRLTNIAAAIGQAQLRKLPLFNAARRRNADWLSAELADVDGITTPVEPSGHRHVYHQYTIRVDDRDTLRTALDDAGIDSAVYYPIPIHRQDAYEGYDADCPVVDAAAADVLSLPVHPGLSRDDVERIAATIREHQQPSTEVQSADD